MAFDMLHNYYERRVFEQLKHEINAKQLTLDSDTLEDIACVALNRLPARYIRHDIDLAFYLTSEERDKLENSVREAVKYATNFVLERQKTQASAD